VRIIVGCCLTAGFSGFRFSGSPAESCDEFVSSSSSSV